MPRNFIPWWNGWGFVFVDWKKMLENATNLINIPALLGGFGVLEGAVFQHLKWIIGVLTPVVVAMVIYRWGILPDIEPRYELRKIPPDSGLLKYPIQQDFFNEYENVYGNLYSHFILFNGGHGKASRLQVEYNWMINGKVGGLSNKAIERAGCKLRYEDYLFPGKEHFSVPALEFRSNVFEEAEWILLRVRYKDIIGFNHCRCAVFESIHGERGFNMVPEFHNSCGWVKRGFKKMTETCLFREDVCSTEALIPIIEEGTSEEKNE